MIHKCKKKICICVFEVNKSTLTLVAKGKIGVKNHPNMKLKSLSTRGVFFQF